jgi:uncharacterized protein YkwD
MGCFRRSSVGRIGLLVSVLTACVETERGESRRAATPQVELPSLCELSRDAAGSTELLRVANAYRQSASACADGSKGPAPRLTFSHTLACAAAGHARDMATRGFFSHVNPDGDTPLARVQRTGFTGSSAENISWGQPSPALAVAAWIASHEHCKPMMSARFTTAGVGHELTPSGRHYWVMILGDEAQRSIAKHSR